MAARTGGWFCNCRCFTGKINPSGKLPDTFFEKYSDVPSAEYFPGTPKNQPEQVIYREGIYVGYRYADKFAVKPTYEFGYGLSYTTFSITDLKLSGKILNKSITVSAKVKNTGKVPGKQVVQIYISAPSKTIDKPSQELKAFDESKLYNQESRRFLLLKSLLRILHLFTRKVLSGLQMLDNTQSRLGYHLRILNNLPFLMYPKA